MAARGDRGLRNVNDTCSTECARFRNSWIGRAIMTVLFGLLIVGFVIWGVGDMFRGFVSDKVAEVGGQSITAQQYQNALQTVMYRIQSRTRRNSPARRRTSSASTARCSAT